MLTAPFILQPFPEAEVRGTLTPSHAVALKISAACLQPQGWRTLISCKQPSPRVSPLRHQQQCSSRGLEGAGDVVFMCKLGHTLFTTVVTSGDSWLSECFVISRRLLGDRPASVPNETRPSHGSFPCCFWSSEIIMKESVGS